MLTSGKNLKAQQFEISNDKLILLVSIHFVI